MALYNDTNSHKLIRNINGLVESGVVYDKNGNEYVITAATTSCGCNEYPTGTITITPTNNSVLVVHDELAQDVIRATLDQHENQTK